MSNKTLINEETRTKIQNLITLLGTRLDFKYESTGMEDKLFQVKNLGDRLEIKYYCAWYTSTLQEAMLGQSPYRVTRNYEYHIEVGTDYYIIVANLDTTSMFITYSHEGILSELNNLLDNLLEILAR